jgi:hypothetical protein
MAAPTSQEDHQSPLIDKAPSNDDFAAPVDCERGGLDEESLPTSLQPISPYFLLRFAGLLSLVLLVHRFWPFPSLLQGWESKSVVGLDDVCPQVKALIPSNHEVLLGSLDAEFSSNEFKLKAYKSLGGAVRIPCAFSLFLLLSVGLIARVY